MPTIAKTLEQAVRHAAANQNISAREAPAIVLAAQREGTKKPIDAVFAAIDSVGASVDTKATRFICANLDQKLSRADWVRYVQKCASPSGAWGPGGEGAIKVVRAELPAAMKKVFDEWKTSDPENAPHVVRFEVAGKSAFLIDQFSEFGTSFGLFDGDGKALGLKQDVTNIAREARRIQGAYDKWFRAPSLKAWSSAVQHTDIGVLITYETAGTYLKGKALTNALTPNVKRVVDEMQLVLKKNPQVDLLRNRHDGSLLVVGQRSDGIGPAQYALFSKQGRLMERFIIKH